MADIARTAGVSLGALYLHFASKQQLFASLGRPDLDQPPARARARREQILAAGLKIFGEKGFAAATMDEIAAAAGLSKAALYGHFGSKEELFVAVLRNVPLTDAIEGVLACEADHDAPLGTWDANDPLGFLTEIARTYLESFRDRQRVDLIRFVVIEAMHDPSVSSLVIERMIERGASRIADRLHRFGFGPRSELGIVSQAFLGMLFAWVLRYHVFARNAEADAAAEPPSGRHPNREDTAAALIAQLFFHGIAKYRRAAPGAVGHAKRKSR